MRQKIKEFIKKHNKANKFFQSKTYQFASNNKHPILKEKLMAQLRNIELLKENIITDIDNEMERLRMLKRIIECWTERDSEFIDLSISENGYLHYKRFDNKKGVLLRRYE